MYLVADVALPAGLNHWPPPQRWNLTPQQVAAQRRAWISEWQRAASC